MPGTEPEVICRHTFDAQQLVTDFPPRLYNANKQVVYRIACPPGCRHGGRLEFSRWRSADLPPTLQPGNRHPVIELREDVFGYEPTPPGSSITEWYLNFADQ